MALDKETREEIRDFVKQKPRTVQEIAQMIGRSWRTADRYLEKMEKEEGYISRRTFRKGTRGALKISYWNNINSFSTSKVQEQLLKKIETGRKKEDFSPFDIYQSAEKDKRNAFMEKQRKENVEAKHDIFTLLRQAQEKIMFFSGDLSWVNLTYKDTNCLDVFRELSEEGVNLFFLGRVDTGSMKNAEKLFDLKKSLKKDKIKVRHNEHPLRAFIVDNTFVQMKEMRKTDKDEESEKYLFYEIEDKKWIEWLEKVFWKLYRGSMPGEKRIEDLRTIENLERI